MERTRKRGFSRVSDYAEVHLYGSDTYDEVITKGVQVLSSIEEDDGEHEGEHPFFLRLNGTCIPCRPIGGSEGKALPWTLERYLVATFGKLSQGVKLGVAYEDEVATLYVGIVVFVSIVDSSMLITVYQCCNSSGWIKSKQTAGHIELHISFYAVGSKCVYCHQSTSCASPPALDGEEEE